MAGYLGTKAVLLSTTAADVTGDAEIGGDLTVGGNLTRTDTYETQEEAPEGATERTRLGVRYPELLAFIIGAM